MVCGVIYARKMLFVVPYNWHVDLSLASTVRTGSRFHKGVGKVGSNESSARAEAYECTNLPRRKIAIPGNSE